MMREAGNEHCTIVFGPVPSRRLGRSLGINNIPPKTCSYSCVYCQLGHTDRMQIDRAAFTKPEEVRLAIGKRIHEAKRVGEPIDYLTFVPDGEPTLDLNLGRDIRALRSSGKAIAVITNGSLIWRPDVRDELLDADWVSLKVDSIDEDTWRQVNRPHRELSLSSILDGMVAFAAEFRGRLVTETMLVRGLNDKSQELRDVARFIGRLNPMTAYISAPTRPPAEEWVELPTLSTRVEAHEAFTERIDHVELLMDYEGDEFAVEEDVAQSLLDTTSVHPMREEAVANVLRESEVEWDVIEKLIAEGLMDRVLHDGHIFYVRRLPGRIVKREVTGSEVGNGV